MARDPSALIAILDAHAVIDGPKGLEAVDDDVFRRLGVNAIAHLEADPSERIAAALALPLTCHG